VTNAEQSAGKPVNRQEAEEAYRKLRLAMIWAMLWSLVIAALIVVFGGGGYAIVIAAALVVFELVSTPLWIRYFRRRRDEQIREAEAALGKLTVVS
jgi:Na+-driven multidrug efflux pump